MGKLNELQLPVENRQMDRDRQTDGQSETYTPPPPPPRNFVGRGVINILWEFFSEHGCSLWKSQWHWKSGDTKHLKFPNKTSNFWHSWTEAALCHGINFPSPTRPQTRFCLLETYRIKQHKRQNFENSESCQTADSTVRAEVTKMPNNLFSTALVDLATHKEHQQMGLKELTSHI